MNKIVLICLLAAMALIISCTEKTTESAPVGTLAGLVTIDGEGVSGVQITVSVYNITGKIGSGKITEGAAYFAAGDYYIELTPGEYRVDYVYHEYNGESYATARYPVTINDNFTTTVNVELKDPIPHSVQAEDGDAAVELSWESGFGAAGYRVYRSESPASNFSMINETEPIQGTNHFLDYPPETGEFYYYITSFDSASVESDHEDISRVDFTAAIMPPAGLQAYDMVDYVQLEWHLKPQAVRYHIHRSRDEVTWSVIDTIHGSMNTYIDAPTDTAVYYYSLTAISVYGTESERGQAVSVHYDRRYDPPHGVSITDRGSHLYIAWVGYSNIAYYSVYKSSNPDEDFSLLNTTTNSYYSDTPIDTGTYYYYITVTSPDSLESDPSSTVSAFYDGVLEYPTGFTVENMGLYVALSWNDVQWAAAYRLYRSDDGIVFDQIARVTSTYYSDNPFEEGLYYYKVASETDAGARGRLSNPISVQFTNNLLEPTGVTATNRGTSILIEWDIVEGVYGYEIYRSSSGGSYEFIDSTLEDNFIDIPPIQGYYYYQVRAFDDEGRLSPFSNPAYVYFDDSPLPPENVVAVDLVYRVSVHWETIDTTASFLVYRSDSIDGLYELVGSAGSIVFIDYPSMSDYYFYKVRSIVQSDTSDYSDPGGIFFSGVLDPPEELTAVDVGTHVHLEWTSPEGTTYYNIYRKHVNDDDYLLIGTSYETNDDDAPDSAGTYSYKVKAFTQGDLGSPDSNPVEVYFDP